MPMMPLWIAELESLYSEPAIAYGMKCAAEVDERKYKTPEALASACHAVASYNAAQFDATKAGKRDEFDREMRQLSSGRAA